MEAAIERVFWFLFLILQDTKDGYSHKSRAVEYCFSPQSPNRKPSADPCPPQCLNFSRSLEAQHHGRAVMEHAQTAAQLDIERVCSISNEALRGSPCMHSLQMEGADGGGHAL